MSGPQQLFERFTEEYRSRGEADPREYLDRLEGVDRAELEALIERFLLSAPRRDWDADAFRGSIAEGATERVAIPAQEDEEGWPDLLPTLRNRARLTRRVVVGRLAAALGFPEEEGRVAVYYHQMEQGRLDPAGVSDSVLSKLADILGSTGEALRRAGELGSGPGSGGEVFARIGAPEGELPGRRAPVDSDPGAGERKADELDRLFTGGS
ncbi:MAG: hypothetical protein AB7L91_17120 [Dehalococcoidia bacterium]